MQGILSLNGDNCGGQQHRRKAVRACARCRDLKKRCISLPSIRCCRRCKLDGRLCSLQTGGVRLPMDRTTTTTTTATTTNATPARSNALSYNHSIFDDGMAVSAVASSAQGRNRRPSRLTHRDETPRNFSAPQGLSMPLYREDATRTMPSRPVGRAESTVEALSPTTSDSSFAAESASAERALSTGPGPEAVENTKDSRYVTMLHLLDRGAPESRACGDVDASSFSASKLILGTNPLSALLRKELKHKIVNNSCSFRTPDPVATPNAGTSRLIARLDTGVHGCDWEGHYRTRGLSEPRLQFLRAVHCFELPPPARCSRLLEIYFSHVHPLLPVLDRKDFLAQYYGLDEPPPLVLLHGVFLAASRYYVTDNRPDPAASEVRRHCDDLHSKLRALIEADACSERIAICQATLLASLHWEGREGVNSAMDNLGIAIRICQEMGLHRRSATSNDPVRHSLAPCSNPPSSKRALLRRIWWSAFALDRLNAVQEGTSFLINEADCDAEPLSEDDFRSEDSLTRRVTLLNLSLACLAQDAVRSLYRPGDDGNTLFSAHDVGARRRLSLELDNLASRITTVFQAANTQNDTCASNDVHGIWQKILLSHVCAVRILVHRPFITYAESHDGHSSVFLSRDMCRIHAEEILSCLTTLDGHGTLQFSWPFTVYAVVNCLLIFWYDITSPCWPHAASSKFNGGRVSGTWSHTQQSRKNYMTVVGLLRKLGDTWWAAAAKHKLAEALLKAADELQTRDRWLPGMPQTGTTGREEVLSDAPPADGSQVVSRQVAALSARSSGEAASGDTSFGSWPDDKSDSFRPDTHDQDFWSSLGLDFDTEVAGHVFSLLPLA